MRIIFTTLFLLLSLNASANVGATSKWEGTLVNHSVAFYLDGSLKPSISQQKDIECLSRAIFYEARGEPVAGKVMVANVVVNRTKFGKPFANTICDVVYQKGQFTWTRHKALRSAKIKTIINKNDDKSALESLKIAMFYVLFQPKNTGKATHFSSKNDKFARTLFVKQVGNQKFYRYLGNS